MRTKTLLSMALAGLLMVLVVPRASAERVKTTQTTKVMKRPGEKEAVVTRIPKGRTVTVIAHEGRWMKVRVNGRTGWIARSTTSSEAREEIPRNTRRHPFVDGRSTRRGWTGEAPEDRVGADAVDPDDASASDGDDDSKSDDGDDRPAPKKHKKAVAKKAKHHADADDGDDRDARGGDGDDGDADADAKSDDGDGGDGDGDAKGDDGEKTASADCDPDSDDCDEAQPEKPKPVVVQVTVARGKLREKPSKKAHVEAKVKRGASLTVIDQQKDWMLVEDGDGDQGWIKKTDVFQPGMRPERAIALDARLGFSRLAEVFRSDGKQALSNYDIASASGTISLRADLVQKYGKQYLIGGEARFDYGKSTPGIRYQTMTSAADIPYATYDLDVRAVAGYDFHHKTGAAVFARLGYHYGMFAVDNVGDFTKNLAHLPSETLSGFPIGVALDLPRLTDKVGLTVNADYLLMGKREQTKGLEDGAVSTATGAWAGATMAYQWKTDVTLDVAYNYTYAKTVWSGAAPGSMRGTESTSAARKDTAHALMVGLAKTW